MSKHSLEDLEKRVARLEADASELMEFKNAVERSRRLTKLYAILESAWDGVFLSKEFEGNKPGLYCLYCLRTHESLEPLEAIEVISADSPNFICPRCNKSVTAQKQSGRQPLSPPDNFYNFWRTGN